MIDVYIEKNNSKKDHEDKQKILCELSHLAKNARRLKTEEFRSRFESQSLLWFIFSKQKVLNALYVHQISSICHFNKSENR